jgi:hypothetical protein
MIFTSALVLDALDMNGLLPAGLNQAAGLVKHWAPTSPSPISARNLNLTTARLAGWLSWEMAP